MDKIRGTRWKKVMVVFAIALIVNCKYVFHNFQGLYLLSLTSNNCYFLAVHGAETSRMTQGLATVIQTPGWTPKISHNSYSQLIGEKAQKRS